ncbi:uncharacterized protein LOC131432412 isoform X2 [Malaya genurostris]|uniref:uncharacterized protein LOC131432412 isoform X2 n=1 Tax=Malaya genurostris TaxID=325434 RepID=UPI0026F3BF92|nr:uncharacterized protein LOC131432412 isoform X2 [Malaya genurostris]
MNMSHSMTGMDNASCKNMVSNLPLLFAGGYPTSLEKITEKQLEKFIPFMVQCSLGYIQISTLEEYSEPEWWPSDLEFLVPFNRPKAFEGEHEKVCPVPKAALGESDDDDVIYCGSELLPTPVLPDDIKPVSKSQSMTSFLLNFNLLSKTNSIPVRSIGNCSRLVHHQNINMLDGSPEKLRRLPRRTRGVVTLSKCTSIPLSSPCGQFLLKSIKTAMSDEYRRERLERLERFCFAPPLVKEGAVITNRPKWMNRNRINTNITVSYKKNIDEPLDSHSFKFPRRQFSELCKRRNFLFYNKLLLNKCKPCAIKLERLSVQEIENRYMDIRLKKLNFAKTTISSEGRKHAAKVRHVVVDCIDLCSSEDEGLEMRYSLSEGCFISDAVTANEMHVDNIRQLSENITYQNKKKIEVDSNILPCLRNTTDVNLFLSLDASSSINHSTHSSLTPALHIFSNVRKDTSIDTSAVQMSNDRNIEESGTTKETNFVFLSSVENLTEVKEIRVNNWLNDAAITTENKIHDAQSRLLITSTTSMVPRAHSPCPLVDSSTTVTDNHGNFDPKSLPSLGNFTKSASSVNAVPQVRHRKVTTVDIK